MRISFARIGLLPILTLFILAAAPESAAAAPSGSDRGERVCHLDVAEKRKTANGAQQWLVRQFDRWCVRDGRIVLVRQTLEAETSNGWRLVSKSATTRMNGDGTARSQGRFHLSKRNAGSCDPRITGTLHTDGQADYSVESGC